MPYATGVKKLGSLSVILSLMRVWLKMSVKAHWAQGSRPRFPSFLPCRQELRSPRQVNYVSYYSFLRSHPTLILPARRTHSFTDVNGWSQHGLNAGHRRTQGTTTSGVYQIRHVCWGTFTWTSSMSWLSSTGSQRLSSTGFSQQGQAHRGSETHSGLSVSSVRTPY